jgi:hypothetical protein
MLGWLAGCGGATTMGDGRSNAGAGDGGAKEQPDSGGTVKTVDPLKPRCGDGQLDPGELCDGLHFPTTDCDALSMGTFRTGKLHCTATCSIEFLSSGDPLPGVDCVAPLQFEGCLAPCPDVGSGRGCCTWAGCRLDHGWGCDVPPPAVDSGATGAACAPQFCPSVGSGVGCCVTSNGPCGVDYGMGCVAPSPDGGR